MDAFTKQLEIAKYSRLVAVVVIEANDYNLNVPRHIDSTEPEELQAIDSHLRAGIPTGMRIIWTVTGEYPQRERHWH